MYSGTAYMILYRQCVLEPNFLSNIHLTLCIWETPKRVLLQTMNTQMKYSIMLNVIRVYTVCKGKNDLQTKETIYFENYSVTCPDMYNRLSQIYCIRPE